MYHFFISFRYIKSRFITIMSIGGVAMGVMVLIVVLSVMDGFRIAFAQRVRGTLSDIIIQINYRLTPTEGGLSYQQLEHDILKLPHVKYCAPHFNGLVLLGTGYSWSGAKIMGIDYAKECRVGKFRQYLVTAYKERKLWAEKLFDENVRYPIRRLYRWRVEGGEPVPDGTRIICTRQIYRCRHNEVPRYPIAENLTAFTINQAGKIIYWEKYLPRNTVIVKFRTTIQKQHWQRFFQHMSEALVRNDVQAYLSFFDPHFKHDQASLDLRHPFRLRGEEAEYPPLIVGYPIMQNHNLRPGQEIALLTGVRDPETRKIKPRSKKFQVVGAFRCGWQEIDAYYLYTPIQNLKGFLGIRGEVTEICVALDDYKYADLVCNQLRALARQWARHGIVTFTQKWEQRRRTMLAAIQLERNVMAFILSMIVCLAVASIVIILVLLVIEKTRDIGILKSMGVSNNGIMAIFVLNGLIISILGSLLGCGLGILISENVNWLADRIYELTTFRVFPRDIYYLDRIPVTDITFTWLLSIIGPTLALSLIFCMIPAVRAARQEPVEALKWE